MFRIKFKRRFPSENEIVLILASLVGFGCFIVSCIWILALDLPEFYLLFALLFSIAAGGMTICGVSAVATYEDEDSSENKEETF